MKPDDTKREAGLVNRRQFLKAGAAAGMCAALPGAAGCSALPEYKTIAASDEKILYLVHCSAIDVEKGEVARNKTVVIRQGVIASIDDAAAAFPPDAAVLDLKGRYLMPGLIDAHCHTTLTGGSQLGIFDVPAAYRQFKRNFIRQLSCGVTTVRDMGAMPKLLHDGLAMIARGDIIGPRVVFCNAFTNVYRGHPDIDPRDVSIFSGLALALAGDPNLWFRQTAELPGRMEQNIAGGASFIKLTLDKQSVLCGRGEIPAYSDEQLKIIMAFAAKHGLPVAGHVHTRFGFDRALQYGLQSIEHLLGDADVTLQDAQDMVKRRMAIVPTLAIAQMYAAPEAYEKLPPPYRTDLIAREIQIRKQYLLERHDEDVEPSIHKANMAALGDYQAYGCEQLYRLGRFMARPDLYFNILLRGPGNLLRMKQAGVLIGCGTDAGVPLIYPGTLWREMEMLGRIGLTVREVLQCATINNARILRLDDKIGTIEKGKFADLIVLADNPLEKIETCRAPQLVIKDGRVYDVTKKV